MPTSPGIFIFSTCAGINLVGGGANDPGCVTFMSCDDQDMVDVGGIMTGGAGIMFGDKMGGLSNKVMYLF